MGVSGGVLVGFVLDNWLLLLYLYWVFQYVEDFMLIMVIVCGIELVVMLFVDNVLIVDIGLISMDGIVIIVGVVMVVIVIDGWVVVYCGVLVVEQYFDGLGFWICYLLFLVSKLLVVVVVGVLYGVGVIEFDVLVMVYVFVLVDCGYVGVMVCYLLDM